MQAAEKLCIAPRRETHIVAAHQFTDQMVSMPIRPRPGVVPPCTASMIGLARLAIGQRRQCLSLLNSISRIVTFHVFTLHCPVPIHQRSPSRVPSSGRNRSAIASRARKIRERTVPIGQFITLLISS